MKVSSHEEYGLRCLVRVGREGPGGRLTIPEISQSEGLSEAYTAKLLRLLRLGGFLKAARGTGGYSLARPAAEISLSDVLVVLGGRLYERGFCKSHTGQMKACVRTVDCSLRVVWETVQAAVDEVLGKMTLADLLRDEQQMVVWVQDLGEFASNIPRQ